MRVFTTEPYGKRLMEKAPKLKRLLERYQVPVFITDEKDSVNAFLMYAMVSKDVSKSFIVIKERNLRIVSMTDEEVIAILWHEAAHAIYHADEYEADRLAIDMTSFEIWKSAIRKINMCLQIRADKPEHPKYTHRDSLMIRGGVIHEAAGNQADRRKPKSTA